MALASGTRLGPYEVVAPLGAGGMGEVYRARDTRLDRTVAIKILSAGLSRDDAARQRFEREARAASSLNHPHICALYDVGQAEGIDFLVMEYLEGETLAARLERGPVPLDETLRVATQVGDALDKAHRQGLTHRDLKPGNVMLTKTGAKLLDFGLAKTTAGGAGGSSMAVAPTMTTPLTVEGSVVGTLQYMAPEQLEGGEATPRSDIFAFGALLYEMLTGERPFGGKTQASLVAAILKDTPRPMSALRPHTSPALERLVETCLVKDPDERRQSMHDVLLELRWIAERGPEQPVASATPAAVAGAPASRLPWIIATAALGVAAAVILLLLRTPAPAAPPRKTFTFLLPPPGQAFESRRGPMAVSPDGRQVAFVARDAEGARRVWIRSLDEPDARPVAGTAGARYPFWSPDGRSIGFGADGKLKRVDAAGGTPDTLCEAPEMEGGSWGRDGFILFAPGWRRGIERVSSSGGEPTMLTRLDPEQSEHRHRHPFLLPDGRHFLFAVRRGIGGRNGISIGSIDGGAPRHLLDLNSNAVYVPQGYLLYWRDDALRAHPFDPERLEFTGAPIPVAPGARLEPDQGVALFSVSANGVLAFHRGGSATAKSRLVLRDRQGNEVATVGAVGNYYSPRFSSDGRSVAVDNSGVENNGDIWVHELARPVGTRLTFDATDESQPVWSPDGSRIAFVSFREGTDADVRVTNVAGSGGEEVLVATELRENPEDWSPDGRHLLFTRQPDVDDPATDVWVLSLEDHAERPFAATPFDEGGPRFAPDGRWIAYTSNESGRNEVYVRPFPEGERKWQVSTGGGSGPSWRGDGKELFYYGADGRIWAVGIETGDGVNAAPPVPLFAARTRFERGDDYDAAPDGRQFIVNTSLVDEGVEPMALVTAWTAGLDR